MDIETEIIMVDKKAKRAVSPWLIMVKQLFLYSRHTFSAYSKGAQLEAYDLATFCTGSRPGSLDSSKSFIGKQNHGLPQYSLLHPVSLTDITPSAFPDSFLSF